VGRRVERADEDRLDDAGDTRHLQRRGKARVLRPALHEHLSGSGDVAVDSEVDGEDLRLAALVVGDDERCSRRVVAEHAAQGDVRQCQLDPVADSCPSHR